MEQTHNALVYSLSAQLTESISTVATAIKVNSVEDFPEAPNLIAISFGNNFEVIRYNAIGELTLEQCERGIEGVTQSFPKGAKVARHYSTIEYSPIVENVEEAHNTKTELGSLDHIGSSIIENGNSNINVARGTRVALPYLGYAEGAYVQSGQQTAVNSNHSIALNQNFKANSSNDMVLRRNAKTSRPTSIALEYTASASSCNFIALGYNSKVSSNDTTTSKYLTGVNGNAFTMPQKYVKASKQ